MTGLAAGPFFEIGPKNLLRRAALEPLALAAGRASADFGVTVVLTVPAPLVTAVATLFSGVLVFAQGMDVAVPRDALGRVTAADLADAGAAGVMLNHDSNPLGPAALEAALSEARDSGLEAIVCAGTEEFAMSAAALAPTVVLYEPPALIGGAGDGERPWIPAVTAAIHASGVRAMHAGGISSPTIARAVMAAGADGTGSTSGVVLAADPPAAASAFIAAARAGWDDAHSRPETTRFARSANNEGEQR